MNNEGSNPLPVGFRIVHDGIEFFQIKKKYEGLMREGDWLAHRIHNIDLDTVDER